MGYYLIDNNQVTIRPLLLLKYVGIALLLLFIFMPLVTILIALKGDFSQLEPESFASFFIITPLMLACIPLFTYSQRRIIFDGSSRMVVLKTIFGSKQVMNFDQIADIVPQSTTGLSYYLKSKEDRYGKGILVSPFFTGKKNDREQQVFEQEVLPFMLKLISAHALSTSHYNSQSGFSTDELVYYTKHFDGYKLNCSMKKYLPGLIIVVLAAVWGWYRFFTTPVLSSADKQFAYIPLFPLVFLIAVFTKRIVVNKGEHVMKLSYFGIVFATYHLNDFKGFNIVRKTHNGVYNGTDVRMRFNKNNSKRDRELTLKDFNKTMPIESFLKETELVINK